jgi:hypothetical protein
MKTAATRSVHLAGAAVLCSGCNALASIPANPPQSPASWLSMQPYVEFHTASGAIVLVQPTTTAIVYLLGIVALASGVYFLWIRGVERARLWWGIALLLWGAGALTAGTSYEAFSYHIKCVGRATCAWTSWWEVSYLLLTMASVNAIVVAQSFACAQGTLRTWLARYAAVHATLYTVMVLVGALVPFQTLISFEMLLIACVPSAVICLAINVQRCRATRGQIDRALLIAWAWMALTIAAYYLYLTSGWTQRLWERRIWFTENDVLHIGLVLWMMLLVRIVAPHLVDQPDAPTHDGVRTEERA